MKAKTQHKRVPGHDGNGHDGNTLDTMIASARDQYVEPAMQAVRDAGHQIEQGYHDTIDYVGGRLKKVETDTAANPMRALAYAVGAGVLIGFWLGRK